MILIHPSLKLSLAAVLVAGLPVAATAGEDNLSPLWFSLDLGAGMGLTQDNYQQQADDAGLDVTLNNANAPRLAWKIGAGWNLWQAPESPLTLATQLEWFDLGQVDLSYSGSVSQSRLENLYDELKNIHPESGNGLALGFSGRWQGFGQDQFRALGLGAELGATYWWQTYELNGVEGDVVRTDDTSGAGWYAGLLSDYALTPQWRLRGGWRVYGLDTETAQTFSLGLAYSLKTRADEASPAVASSPEPVSAPEPVSPPLGRPDQYSLDQAGTGRFDVLANDSDPEGKPLRLVWVEGSRAGNLDITDDGTRVRYEHDEGNATRDSFRYWFSNGVEEVGPVHVEVRILPARPNPVEDHFQVGYQTISRLDVLANDTDPNQAELALTRVSQPESGRVEVVNDILVYFHTGNSSGKDRLQYWVSNGQSEAGPVSVELDILPAALTIPIRFERGTVAIPDSDEPLLDRLAQWLEDNPEASLAIAGHTDASGNAELNRRLSKQRAQAVMDYLLNQGIAEHRLSATGYGPDQPLADNDSAAGRALNRRVEVRLE